MDEKLYDERYVGIWWNDSSIDRGLCFELMK